MIVISSALKADVLRKIAEENGLVFVKKTGMNMEFENPAGNDAEFAVELKKKMKATKEIAALMFQVNAR